MGNKEYWLSEEYRRKWHDDLSCKDPWADDDSPQENIILTKYYAHGDTFMTATQIAKEISYRSGKKMNAMKIGKALANHGFKRVSRKIKRVSYYGWLVRPKQQG